MNRNTKGGICWIAALLAMLATSVSASPGDLDPAFGDGGRVRFTLPGAGVGIVDMIVQSDGKIVVLGRTPWIVQTGGIDEIVVARFIADGALDTTFNRIGYKLIGFNGSDGVPGGIAQQTDGKLIVVGGGQAAAGNSDFVAMRLNGDGSTDLSFGTNGSTFVDFGTNGDAARRVVIQPDGAIVLAGITSSSASSGDLAFTRLTATGVLDTNFGTQGKTLVDVMGVSDFLSDFIRQTDGKYVAVGNGVIGTNVYAGEIVRLNSQGQLDTTFGNGGTLTLSPSTTYSSVYISGVAQQADGKLVIAGSVLIPAGGQKMAMTRLGTTGAIDTPITLINIGAPAGTTFLGSLIDGMTLTHDGSILLAGAVYGVNPAFVTRGIVAQFSTLTTPDTSYGTASVAFMDFGVAAHESNEYMYRLRQLSDGRVIVGGNSFLPNTDRPSFVLARLLATGGSPGTLSVGGTASPIPIAQTSPLTVASEGNVFTIPVTRTGGSSGTVSIQYSLIGITATAGTDFVASSGAINWADGDSATKLISVQLLNDGIFTAVDKIFRVTLSAPTGNATVGTASFDVAIRNTTPAALSTLSFNQQAFSVSEDVSSQAAAVSITVSRSGPVGLPASVNYSTADGTAKASVNYSSVSGTLSWTSGETATKTISVPLLSNNIDEPDKTFSVRLSNPTNAEIAQTDLTVTIRDKNPSPFIELAQSSTSVNESASSTTLTVTRVGASEQSVSVDYATQSGAADTADYAPTSGTLTWAAGDVSPKTISVSIVNDTVVENTETFSLRLSNVTGGAVIGNDTTSVSILDDDVAPAPSPTPTPSPPASPPAATDNGGKSGGGSVTEYSLASLALLLLCLGIRSNRRRENTLFGESANKIRLNL